MTNKVSNLLLISLNGLLLTLAVFSEQLQIPLIFQVAGRMHPMLLHLPIGFLLFIIFIRIFYKSFGLEYSSVFFRFAFQATAYATVLSAIAGCILATEESYASDLISRHRNTGTLLSLLTLVLSKTHEQEKPFRIAGTTAIFLLFLTGHYGSGITHGENFILNPLKPINENIAVISDSSTIYEAALMPVLEKKCNSCHNPARKKGNLDMTSWEGLTKGGKNGPIWDVKNVVQSNILKRIHLPDEHEDHMPPVDKQQLNKNEKILIELFIKSGANRLLKLENKNSVDSLRNVAWRIASQKTAVPKRISRPFTAISPEKIKELSTSTRTIAPLSADDPALRVGFYLAGDFSRIYLEELNDISENITELYLSGMPVKDDDLNGISGFKNLEILFLNNTLINDRSLEALQKLTALRKISVSNTQVSETGIESLLKIKSLKEISAWNTKSNPEKLQKIIKSNPSISWILGEVPSREILQLTPPILVNESRILKTGEKILFKHNLPGVTIRYATGLEKDPDSVNGKIYAGPIYPERFTRIRLKAFKEGWKLSNGVEATFFTAGLKPSSGKLLTPPAKDYRANGVKTLTDSQAGDQDNHRDGQWLGYRENSLSASFEFEEGNEPGSVTISYLKNTGSYIFPPARIIVHGGNAQEELIQIAVRKPTQPASYDRNEVLGESIEIPKSYRYMKITIEPVGKLPQWHGGKGQRAWIFSDEIFFYPRPTI